MGTIYFNAGKKWKDEDLQWLIESYNTVDKEIICKKLGRNLESIRTKYFVTLRKERKKDELLYNCKNCNSKNINIVANERVKTSYCLDCLLEFNKDGILQPIWE